MVVQWVRKMFGRERKWKLVSSICGALAAMVAEKLMSAGYRAIRKDTAPVSPFDPADTRFTRGVQRCVGRWLVVSVSGLPRW